MNNQIKNNNKCKDQTLRLKDTDDLINQILELKNTDSKDILELMYMANCIKYLENKEIDFSKSLSNNLNNTKH